MVTSAPGRADEVDRHIAECDVSAGTTEAANEELIGALNELLEGERAGARVARAFSSAAPDETTNRALLRIGRDETWCCAMLIGHIERLGGRVSLTTGAFYDKAQRRSPGRQAWPVPLGAWLLFTAPRPGRR